MAGPYLVQGSRGTEVIELQKKLNDQLFPKPNLVTDGIFGPKTKQAVMAFQRQAGLVVDGIVGPRTRAALGLPLPSNPYTHRVGLHFRSLTLTNVPFNSILSHTQAVYANYGIRVDFMTGLSMGLSPEDQAKFSQIDGTCTWEVNSGEYKELLDLGSNIPNTEITVFFVDRFSQAINGCGGHMKNKPACIVAREGTQWCTAHEVCHVLLGSTFSPVHINDTSNLMHPVDIQRAATPFLTETQINRIKASSLCLPL